MAFARLHERRLCIESVGLKGENEETHEETEKEHDVVRHESLVRHKNWKFFDRCIDTLGNRQLANEEMHLFLQSRSSREASSTALVFLKTTYNVESLDVM